MRFGLKKLTEFKWMTHACALLACFFLCQGMAYSNQRDSLALIALHDALDGPNWTNTWDFTEPIDDWHGVTTNANGDVVFLDLGSNQLKGEIPEQIGFLSELQELKLEFNQISGGLPLSMGILVKLRTLVAFGNDLNEPLPDTLVNLGSLEQISLSDNKISGTLPARIGEMSALKMLIMDRNQLTGSLPPSIGNCSQLSFLALNDNLFDGTVPEELGNLKNLREFLIFNNSFIGELPSQLVEMDSLVFFWVHNNKFTGALPAFDQEKLTSIRVNDNQLSELPDLTGLNLGAGFPEGVSVQNNLLSFDDILINLGLNSFARFSYRPQDTLGEFNTYYANEGERLQVILPFDDTVSTSAYRWFKDGDLNQLINQNALIINNIQKDEEGMYHAEVRNNVIQDLVLITRAFQVVVRDSINCDEPPAGQSCFGAPTFCTVEEMDLYCGTLPAALDTLTCLNIGLSSEARWLSWIADSQYLSLELLPFSCSQLSAGIQWELYENCRGRRLLHCAEECTSNNTEIELDNLIPGESYFLAIRSCGGTCKYQVRIQSGGDRIRTSLGSTIGITDTICSFSDQQLITLSEAPGSVGSFYWILDGDTATTTQPEWNWLPGAVGTYNLCVFGITDCDTTATLCKDITVFDGPVIRDVRTSVVRNDSFYIVQFNILGGGANIFIDSLSGTYNTLDKTFVSDPIRCGLPYTVVVRDETGCTDQWSGLEVCNCSTEAGRLPADLVNTCGANDLRVGSPSGMFLDSNDATTFYILSQQVFEIGAIINGANSGIFEFDSSLYEMDRVYYGFHVVGNRKGMGVDLFDPCLSSSNPRPMIWYSLPAADAGTDTRYCQNSFFLRARISRTSATGMWRLVSGQSGVDIEDETAETTQVTVNVEGVYQFEWTETQTNCEASDTVSIEVLPEIQGEILGPDSLCSGQVDTLELSRDFDRYEWSTGDTTKSLVIDEPGQYCVEVFRDQLCSRRICILVKDAIVASPDILGDLNICDGEITRLQVIPEYESYSWNTGEDRFFIEVDSPGTYCITVTDFSGCQATDCVVVVEDGSRKTVVTDTLCFGDSLVVLDSVLRTSGTYFISEKSSGDCDTLVEVNLLVYPEIFIADSLIVRDDGSMNGSISVNVRGGAPPFDFLWNTGATIPFISGLSEGIYSLLVTDQNECTQIFTFDLREPNSAQDWQREHWSISPNPTSASLEGIYLNSNDRVIKGIYNYRWVHVDGSEVRQGAISSLTRQKSGFIPISGLPEGVYLLYVQQADTQLRQVFRVIIKD